MAETANLSERIGKKVAQNLAEHFENFTIPTIQVCIYQLKKIKNQLTRYEAETK